MTSPEARQQLLQLLLQQRDEVQRQWLLNLYKQDTNWSERIDDSALHAEVDTFLTLFIDALQTTEQWDSIQAEAFTALRRHLIDLSNSRVIEGFTPSETALYVFALKQAMHHMAGAGADEKTQSLLSELLSVEVLLDQLGLLTVESYLNHREALIVEQSATILEMASPTLLVWDHVVLLPLVGVIDTDRAQVILDSLLTAISETESVVAILDVTGVPVIDTQVAKHILTAVEGAHMLGASVIITGVSVETAKTLTKLQINLGDVITRGTLRAGLRYALHLVGVHIEKNA